MGESLKEKIESELCKLTWEIISLQKEIQFEKENTKSPGNPYISNLTGYKNGLARAVERLRSAAGIYSDMENV